MTIGSAIILGAFLWLAVSFGSHNVSEAGMQMAKRNTLLYVVLGVSVDVLMALFIG